MSIALDNAKLEITVSLAVNKHYDARDVDAIVDQNLDELKPHRGALVMFMETARFKIRLAREEAKRAERRETLVTGWIQLSNRDINVRHVDNIIWTAEHVVILDDSGGTITIYADRDHDDWVTVCDYFGRSPQGALL